MVFQQVFNEYHEKLYSFILNKSKSEYLAEEVVQITFIKLWKYKSSLNEDFAISTHLFRIGITTHIDLLRKESNNRAMIKELTTSRSEILPGSTEVFDEKELAKSMATVINNMPDVQRKVFEMSRLEGMSYKQIAETLSISVKTVEVHISRALKRIRKQLPIVALLLFYFLNE